MIDCKTLRTPAAPIDKTAFLATARCPMCVETAFTVRQ